jgi:hypothetical protein
MSNLTISNITLPNLTLPNLTLLNLASPNLASPNLASLQRAPPNLLLLARGVNFRELGPGPRGLPVPAKNRSKTPAAV